MPVLLMFMSGCSGFFSGGKSCVQAIDSLPEELIPGVYFSYSEFQIYSQIYETLLRISDDNRTLLPNLAESWVYTEDKRHLDICLKPGIFFHDHSPLNAAAAKSSIEWIRNRQPHSVYLSNIDSIVVDDSLRFRLTLKKPDARFLYFLASGLGIVMVSPHALDGPVEELFRHPVGTGPFAFRRRNEDGIVLERFAKYRNAGGTVSFLHFRFFPYSRRLEKALQKGRVDVVYMIRGNEIDRLRWSGEIAYIVNESIHCNMLAFNLENPHIQDVLLRKAVLTAIDLEKLIIQNNRGSAVRARNPLPPVYAGFGDLQQPPYNPDQSRRFLKEGGYGNPGLRFCFPEYAYLRITFLQALESYLGRQGISLNVEAVDSAPAYETAIRKDSTQLFLYGWRSDILGDAGNYLWSLFHSDSPHNLFRYSNRHVDFWLEQSRIEFDNIKRNEYYRQVVRQVLEDTPAVFLNHLKEYYAYNTRKIESISMTPYGIIEYKDVILHERR